MLCMITVVLIYCVHRSLVSGVLRSQFTNDESDPMLASRNIEMYPLLISGSSYTKVDCYNTNLGRIADNPQS